jgi:hypothetical protein
MATSPVGLGIGRGSPDVRCLSLPTSRRGHSDEQWLHRWMPKYTGRMQPRATYAPSAIKSATATTTAKLRSGPVVLVGISLSSMLFSQPAVARPGAHSSRDGR